ncbi:MAG: DNA adenine methylase [Hyphomicrobium sp.]|jgi:DNA adenine methylase
MAGPLRWVGGKSRLADQLIAWFPPHRSYIEPFCGGAQVFFRKERSHCEILNDLDGELVNFLRVCQSHHEELVRSLRYAVSSRRLFDLHRRQDPALLTDIQRAARFLYLQRMSWGGAIRDQHYGAEPTKPGRFSVSATAAHIERAAKRLEHVQLENLPYEEILTRYDRPDSLFYCDPPYVDMPYYKFNLHGDDFRLLAERLATLKGQFLLSINDHPLAREVMRAFHIREVVTKYSLGRKVSARELIVSNVPLRTIDK